MKAAVVMLSEQAQVTDWPMRILLTAVTLLVIAALLLLLRSGWRRRQRRQGWAPLPAVPETSPQEPAVTGKYVGTVREGDWLDRIVAGGAMARTQVTTTEAGLLLQRQGEPPLFIAHGRIIGWGTAPGMLQKVFGRHGVLTVTWVWNEEPVVSGIWFPDVADQHLVGEWIDQRSTSHVSEERT